MLVKELKKSKKLFVKTVNTLDELNPREKFKVKDLYKGYEWNRIPLKNKVLLEIMFNSYSHHKGKRIVSPHGKTITRQNLYKKLK